MSTHPDDLSSINLDLLKQEHNWQRQFRLITAWGMLIQPKALLRSESYRVKGCETAAWLAHERIGELHYFYFDSDSKIIRGLAAVVLILTSAKTTTDIEKLDLDNLLITLGIRTHLTPSRNNGLRAILTRIKNLSAKPDP